MDVVDAEGVAVEADIDVHRFVARRLRGIDNAAAHNAVLAENGHAELISQLVFVRQQDFVCLLVVLDVERFDDGIRGIESGFPSVVVAIFLNTKNIGLFLLQKLDHLTVKGFLVAVIDVEGFGVVAHHLQTVGADFGLVDAAELEMLIYIVDVQQYGDSGNQRPTIVDDQPYHNEYEVDNQQIGEEEAAVGDGAGERGREELGGEGEQQSYRAENRDNDE